MITNRVMKKADIGRNWVRLVPANIGGDTPSDSHPGDLPLVEVKIVTSEPPPAYMWGTRPIDEMKFEVKISRVGG